MANVSTGLPSNAVCVTCRGTGWVTVERDGERGAVRCECRKKAIAEAFLKQLDPMFRAADLDTIHAMNPSQVTAISELLKNPNGNFFITGGYGLGKTYLLAAQFVWVSRHGVRTFFRTAEQLVQELYRHYAAKDADFEMSPILAWAGSGTPVHVFIDDVDKIDFDRTAFRKETLFNVIDTLCRKELGLSVTSNMTCMELQDEERLSPAVVRRFDDMCRVLQLGN